MRKCLVIIFIFLYSCIGVNAQTIVGKVDKNLNVDACQVIDKKTLEPIKEVYIKIPSKNYSTKSDENGFFKLQTDFNSPTIISLEKSGYKPYSMTVDKKFEEPFVVSIEKSNANDIVLETDVVHLGDNYFSEKSANASEFSLYSSGPEYAKEFPLKTLNISENLYFSIGSIIGIDTLMSKKLRQSGVITTFASPPEIFFNGKKIAELKINGDGQEIMLPKSFVKENSQNEIRIRTGVNQKKISGIDYDDIEFTNLMIEVK